MLTKEQMQSTLSFSGTIKSFIKQDEVTLLMDQSRYHNQVKNSFFVYDKDSNKHFLGEIRFHNDSYDHFIDYDVILSLKEKGWI